jgi:hypothetical protein
MSEPALPRCEFEQDKLVIRADIAVSADPGSISAVVNAVLAIAAEMKCAAGKEFEIETALREALANAVLHGCGNDRTKHVQCCVACDQSRGMILVVEGFLELAPGTKQEFFNRLAATRFHAAEGKRSEAPPEMDECLLKFFEVNKCFTMQAAEIFAGRGRIRQSAELAGAGREWL